MRYIHRKVKSSHKKQLTLEEEKTLDHIIFGFTGIMVTITLLSGTVLFSSNFITHADNQNSTNVAVNVANSCTMSGSGMNSHNTTISNGTYVKNIGTTTLTVHCNDPNGFVIYAIGDGDSSKGVNYLDSSLGDDYDISTGTATSGNVSNWAMQVRDTSSNYTFSEITATYNGTNDNTIYGAVPSTYTVIAKRNSGTAVPYGTDIPSSGSTLQTTYAAYISTIQPAGTYIGKVKYTMLHPNTASDPKTLEQSLANTLGSTMTDANSVEVDGTRYYKMQNTAANWDTICNNATIINTTATLADTRDNQLYTVAKTVDNKCWMTKNLNIAGGTALSSDDTDFVVSESYSLPTTNGWTVNEGKLVLPASDNTGFGTDNYAYVFNSGKEGTNCSSPGCYSYYSWDTATVGSGRTITTDNTDAQYSMCPKGWHLPNTRTGTDNTSDFRQLMYALGGIPTVQTYTSETNPTGATIYNKLAAQPFGFLRGGTYLGGTFGSGGSDGGYWSATSSSSTRARNLNFNSTDVNSANSRYRRYGFSVRCIAGSH